MEWLTEKLASFGVSWEQVLVAVLISVGTFVGSIAITLFVLVKLPANYFHPSHEREFWIERHLALRVFGIVAKNLLGLFLVFLGIIMSLPGVPGQGVLTILLGVMLLDFPGKRRLEQKLVSRPRVLRVINRLRARFDKPPLLLDE
jgi:hypothetical protein